MGLSSVIQTDLKNPFNGWEACHDTHFVGRDREMARIDQAISSQRGISLVGDWQMGKSSIIQVLRELYLQRGHTVALLSGLGSESRSVQTFVETITGHPVADEADRAADALSEWAEMHYSPEKPPLLLIDDAESCIQRFPLRFFERMRGMLYKLIVVLATTQELDLVAQQAAGAGYPAVSPLDNRLEIVRLGLLPIDAAESVIQKGIGMLETADMDLLRLWAGRHPFYLQLLGSHLWQARVNGEDNEQALDTFYAHVRNHLRQLWNSLKGREQQALLDALENKRIKQRNLRLRGLITENGEFFGYVLREWLEQEAEI